MESTPYDTSRPDARAEVIAFLNAEARLADRYGSHCRQKTDTRRLTFCILFHNLFYETTAILTLLVLILLR